MWADDGTGAGAAGPEETSDDLLITVGGEEYSAEINLDIDGDGVADTAVIDMPNSEELADIAEEAAGMARRLGYEPRVAMLAYSTFGHPTGERSERVRDAVKILDKRRVDFEYDGEMAADVALNTKVLEQYPFCRLSGTANVLVMPAFHSASISTKMLQELGGSTVIGPLLVGLDKSIQIVSMGAKDSDLVNMAAIAAYHASS